MYPQWTRDNQATQLCLLMIDLDIPEAEIASWTDEQCQKAEEYAAAIHLRASDNIIRIPPMPEFLKKFATDDSYPSTQKCRFCGCTDDDCTQCIEAQGYSCHWAEPNLCSRCAPIAKTIPIPVKSTTIQDFTGTKTPLKGNDLIEIICQRLQQKGELCTDSNIVREIRFTKIDFTL